MLSQAGLPLVATFHKESANNQHDYIVTIINIREDEIAHKNNKLSVNEKSLKNALSESIFYTVTSHDQLIGVINHLLGLISNSSSSTIHVLHEDGTFTPTNLASLPNQAITIPNNKLSIYPDIIWAQQTTIENISLSNGNYKFFILHQSPLTRRQSNNCTDIPFYLLAKCSQENERLILIYKIKHKGLRVMIERDHGQLRYAFNSLRQKSYKAIRANKDNIRNILVNILPKDDKSLSFNQKFSFILKHIDYSRKVAHFTPVSHSDNLDNYVIEDPIFYDSMARDDCPTSKVWYLMAINKNNNLYTNRKKRVNISSDGILYKLPTTIAAITDKKACEKTFVDRIKNIFSTSRRFFLPEFLIFKGSQKDTTIIVVKMARSFYQKVSLAADIQASKNVIYLKHNISSLNDNSIYYHHKEKRYPVALHCKNRDLETILMSLCQSNLLYNMINPNTYTNQPIYYRLKYMPYTWFASAVSNDHHKIIFTGQKNHNLAKPLTISKKDFCHSCINDPFVLFQTTITPNGFTTRMMEIGNALPVVLNRLLIEKLSDVEKNVFLANFTVKGTKYKVSAILYLAFKEKKDDQYISIIIAASNIDNTAKIDLKKLMNENKPLALKSSLRNFLYRKAQIDNRVYTFRVPINLVVDFIAYFHSSATLQGQYLQSNVATLTGQSKKIFLGCMTNNRARQITFNLIEMSLIKDKINHIYRSKTPLHEAIDKTMSSLSTRVRIVVSKQNQRFQFSESQPFLGHSAQRRNTKAHNKKRKIIPQTHSNKRKSNPHLRRSKRIAKSINHQHKKPDPKPTLNVSTLPTTVTPQTAPISPNSNVPPSLSLARSSHTGPSTFSVLSSHHQNSNEVISDSSSTNLATPSLTLQAQALQQQPIEPVSENTLTQESNLPQEVKETISPSSATSSPRQLPTTQNGNFDGDNKSETQEHEHEHEYKYGETVIQSGSSQQRFTEQPFSNGMTLHTRFLYPYQITDTPLPYQNPYIPPSSRVMLNYPNTYRWFSPVECNSYTAYLTPLTIPTSPPYILPTPHQQYVIRPVPNNYGVPYYNTNQRANTSIHQPHHSNSARLFARPPNPRNPNPYNSNDNQQQPNYYHRQL